MGLTNKPQFKTAALIKGAFDLDRAVQGFGIGFDQAKAQSHPALGAAAIAAVKSLEDMGQVAF